MAGDNNVEVEMSDGINERVFNLFVFVKEDYIRELGIVVHVTHGSDSEKLAYLREMAASDVEAARRFSVPRRYRAKLEDGDYESAIDYGIFQQMSNGGRLLEVFDEALTESGAGTSPLICVTPVVDGLVRIDAVSELPDSPRTLGGINMDRFAIPDYVVAYTSDEGFDLGRLLNDDYLRAVKLLVRERYFVSATKLLMSFIDTVAFLHEGDTQGNFQRWLNTFVDLAKVDVTSDELWEFRNSLIHMTNVDSRKVITGKVRRLSFFVGAMPSGFSPQTYELKSFDLNRLIHAVIDGVEKWVANLNQETARFAELIERYDRVLSDVRYEIWSFDDAGQDSS